MSPKLEIGAFATIMCCFFTPANATQFEPGLNQPGDRLFELHNFPGWFKPRNAYTSFNGTDRLLIQMKNDGRAIVNPKEWDNPWYRGGSLIPLGQLTFEKAVLLWGEPRGGTFDLICDLSAEKDVYHLDTKFENGKLKSYRLRGIGILKPEWIEPEPQNQNE